MHIKLCVENVILKKLKNDEKQTECREELANEEHKQMAVLKEFLPEEATEEDILKCFNDVIGQDGFEPIKKNMGVIIKTIKSSLPNADGKLVAQTVQKYLD